MWELPPGSWWRERISNSGMGCWLQVTQTPLEPVKAKRGLHWLTEAGCQGQLQPGTQKPSGPSPSSRPSFFCMLALFFLFFLFSCRMAFPGSGTMVISSSGFPCSLIHCRSLVLMRLTAGETFRCPELVILCPGGQGWGPLIGSQRCVLCGKECSPNEGLSCREE